MSGVFMPTPYTGFKAMRAGLITDTYLDVSQLAARPSTLLDDSSRRRSRRSDAPQSVA